MLKGGENQTNEVFAKYIIIIIVYGFCFYNIFNKDDPYGLYLVMVSLLIITLLFGIFLTMDIEKNGLYLFIKNSIVLSMSSLVITTSIILNFISIALFMAVFDYSRKNLKNKDRKFVDPLIKPPYMISKMTNANEETFAVFKNKLIISTILIFFILGYFAFIINGGMFNKIFLYGTNYFENTFIIINILSLLAIQGFLLYNSIMELIYSIYFLKNKKRNIDIYPVIV